MLFCINYHGHFLFSVYDNQLNVTYLNNIKEGKEKRTKKEKRKRQRCKYSSSVYLVTSTPIIKKKPVEFDRNDQHNATTT